MTRKLTRSEIRKFLMETMQDESINEGEEDWWDYLIPDALEDKIEDMYKDLKKEVKVGIRDYISEEISTHIKENLKEIGADAPEILNIDTGPLVIDILGATHKEIGDCAGKIAVKYIGSKVP